MNRSLLCVAFAVMGCVAGLVAAEEKPKSAAKTARKDSAALEKSLAETLTGATMVGHFTIAGRNTDRDHVDRYDIEKAEKMVGHRWLITSRIKYGTHDVKVPIPLEIYWAGDTPVITVDNVTVPGMGTFVARVMIFGDRYAGTWQHDRVGGHMYGMIERTPPPKTETPVTPAPATPATPAAPAKPQS